MDIPAGVLVYDLETETRTLNKRKASPFHPENYVVAAGFSIDGSKPFGDYFANQGASEANYRLPITDDIKLLVGFNIKFDLLYSWQRPELVAFLKRGGRIWDCQYVEYLLEGQQQHVQFCSMDQCVESYGGTLKIDEVKALWQAGVLTSEIDQDLLMDYLLGNDEIEGDVNNTYLIFKGQWERVNKGHPHMRGMLERRHDGQLATTEIEWNGLYIDVERGNKDREVLADRRDALQAELETYIPSLPPELTFNWNSPVHKSALLFGGSVPYDKWVQHEDDTGRLLWAGKKEAWPKFDDRPVDPDLVSGHSDGLYFIDNADGTRRVQDVYAGGKQKGTGKTKQVSVNDLTKPKGAKMTHSVKFSGYAVPDTAWKATLTDADGVPIYSTGKLIIEKLTVTQDDVPFLKVMREFVAVGKDLGYYWDVNKRGETVGMLTLVHDDNIIHQSLNHTTAVTTRLTSSNPNGQNTPRKDKSDVKAMYTSRFGPAGRVVEIDYSQLEVVVQGLLSRDPQLLADLNAGTDFHCKRLATKLGERYEDVLTKAKDENHPDYPVYSKLRTGAKSFSFERAYGAGAYSIAASTGMSVEDIEALIVAEERMYPGVSNFDKRVEASILSTATTSTREVFIAGKRFFSQTGEWSSPSGTRYVWKEQETPKFMHKHGKYLGFSPTERKNWPVQGEGGFIVQAMLGYLFRLFAKNNNWGGQALLINTVHDCVWLDIANEELVQTVVPLAVQVMQAVPAMYKRTFGMDIPVTFPVDAEVGPNMLDLVHFKQH